MPSKPENRFRSFGANALVAGLWCFFLYRQVQFFFLTGKPVLLFFVLIQSTLVIFFLTRTRAEAVSRTPYDWAVAFVGTMIPLLYAPTAEGESAAALFLVLAGAVIQLMGLLSLNRSLGIVPARRKIKTELMYRLVRHPVYAGYALADLGYLASNFTLFNMLILVSATAFTVLRIGSEEKLLSESELYRAYAKKVRWKLFPFIF